jgi:hypothetical protein
MLERTPESIERLFELYETYFDCLRQDVAAANLSLGSSNPKKTHLERLTRVQFEELLANPTNDQEAMQLWIRRIVRRHENEFPAHQAAG